MHSGAFSPLYFIAKDGNVIKMKLPKSVSSHKLVTGVIFFATLYSAAGTFVYNNASNQIESQIANSEALTNASAKEKTENLSIGSVTAPEQDAPVTASLSREHTNLQPTPQVTQKPTVAEIYDSNLPENAMYKLDRVRTAIIACGIEESSKFVDQDLEHYIFLTKMVMFSQSNRCMTLGNRALTS